MVSTCMAKPDQCPAAQVSSHGQHVWVPKPSADRLHLSQRQAGGRWIDGQLVPGIRTQQVAPLSAIHAALGQQAPRSRPPAAGLRHFAREDHAVAGPEREADRPRHVLEFECFAVSARQQLAACRFVADEMSSDRVALDVIQGERLMCCGRIGSPSNAPGLPPECCPRLVHGPVEDHAACLQVAISHGVDIHPHTAERLSGSP
jgi:hypothetical protein